MPTVYLDWNASAPLRPEAAAAWAAAQAECWGNPSSVHAVGQRARARWHAELRALAALLGCAWHELVLTASGSEALATAISGCIHPGQRVVASAIEHSAVSANIARHGGVRIQVGVDGEGRIDPRALQETIARGCALVCLHLANNELGTIQDLPTLVAAVRAVDAEVPIVLDACQAIGRIPLRISELGVDFLAAAGHKFGAPRGTGLLWIGKQRTLRPLVAGGRQQDDRRSGTEDLAGLCALRAALAAALAQAESEQVRQRSLLERCFARIHADLPQTQWLARAAPRLANSLALAHPGVEGRALAIALDLAGHAVSAGSACGSRRAEPSHVLAALGLPADFAASAIRVSIGPLTSAEDLESFAAAYVTAVRAAVTTS